MNLGPTTFVPLQYARRLPKRKALYSLIKLCRLVKYAAYTKSRKSSWRIYLTWLELFHNVALLSGYNKRMNFLYTLKCSVWAFLALLFYTVFSHRPALHSTMLSCAGAQHPHTRSGGSNMVRPSESGCTHTVWMEPIQRAAPTSNHCHCLLSTTLLQARWRLKAKKYKYNLSRDFVGHWSESTVSV
jgi:hypothetical protein